MCCVFILYITIPNSVTSIEEYAFAGGAWETLSIPASVTNIEEGAFTFCKNLTEISVDSNNTNYCSKNGVLFNKDKTVLLQYPTGKIAVSYKVPDGVETISTRSFRGCLLQTIILPIYKNYDVKVLYWEGHSSLKPIANVFETEIVETVLVDDVLESEHPYADDMNETKTYVYDGECISIDVTFSDDTETESDWDYIYIYDANGNQIGKYSGTELAGQTIRVLGNTIKIRLTSDGSYTEYGYKTESIVVNK